MSEIAAAVEALVAAIAASPEDQRMGAIQYAREKLHGLSKPGEWSPVDFVQWVPIDDVCPNDYNPNSVAPEEMQLLRISIAEDGYCVEESTPILMADLTWRAAGTLVPGDQIIAFDEFATEGAGDRGRKQRRYRTASVTGNSIDNSPLMRVVTDRGELRATPDHPFLAKRNYGKGHHVAEWLRADELRPGDIVIHLMQPWEADRTWESGWLSGFLDGEGTLAINQNRSRTQQTYRLSGYQRPGATADRMIAEMSKRASVKVFTVDRSDHPGWSSMVMARVDRLTEVMRLLGSVRPARLIEQAGRFWEGAALSSSLKSGSHAVIQSVESVDDGRIARLSTSTKTYIANGFAVHNTQPVVAIWDSDRQKYVIVDGFHRYYTMLTTPEFRAKTGDRLPVVVIRKDIKQRMASTVRHNRARGEHAVTGMASMVYSMLDQGWSDAEICNQIGLKPEELVRLKHVTGFSALFADVDYRKSWVTDRMVAIRADWLKKSKQPPQTPAS